MSREIKYQAWISELNKMVQVVSHNFEVGGTHFKDLNGREYFINKGVILREYTGLKDKDGKEIFEGDVLHAKGFWGIYIVWDKENARFGILNTDWVVSQGHITKMPIFELSSVYEIVGNIYENPELLEGVN